MNFFKTIVTALAFVGATSQAAPVVQPRQQSEDIKVFALEKGLGVVVFKTVNGKLVSRCYRA